jgi:cytochrome d ubiquinol oxidase subunit II
MSEIIFLDYGTLRVIWWVLLGVLLIGFAVMDGFDLGTATLLPFVARNDTERRIVINTIGPVWEGNQVWLILGGGAIFAAWPPLYAVSFSGFYVAMFLVLAALILRPVGFKFRGKVKNATWRAFWDLGLFIGGLVPALIFGVAVGNVLVGVPFSFDSTLRLTYEGTFLGLLNPFALLCGLVSVAMLVMHGGVYLAVKAEEPVEQRAAWAARSAAIVLIVLFTLAGVWVATILPGYVAQELVTDGPSNPLGKVVYLAPGAWLGNYGAYPWMLAAPILGYVGALGVLLLLRRKPGAAAFISSAISVSGVVTTAGVSLFPFLLPSSLEPSHSLTVWDASSSQMTLFLMLLCTVIFMPIILLYTSWVFWVMRGKVTAKYISESGESAY